MPKERTTTSDLSVAGAVSPVYVNKHLTRKTHTKKKYKCGGSHRSKARDRMKIPLDIGRKGIRAKKRKISGYQNHSLGGRSQNDKVVSIYRCH